MPNGGLANCLLWIDKIGDALAMPVIHDCLATSYEEFICAIEESPVRAVDLMKRRVRRLRRMNNLTESVGPPKRGLRDMSLDRQRSVGPAELDPEAGALSRTMAWQRLKSPTAATKLAA